MKNYAEIDTSRAVVVGCGLEAVYVVYYSVCEIRKKIGMVVEQSLGARLGDFVMTGAPSALVVELIILTNNARSVERDIHERLHSYKVRGEWFDIPSLFELLDLREFGELAPSFPPAELLQLNQILRELDKRYGHLLSVEDQILGRIKALADHLGILGDEKTIDHKFLAQMRSKIEGLFWIEDNIKRTKTLLCGWENKIKEQDCEIRRLKNELAKKGEQIEKSQEGVSQDRRHWPIFRPFGR